MNKIKKITKMLYSVFIFLIIIVIWIVFVETPTAFLHGIINLFLQEHTSSSSKYAPVSSDPLSENNESNFILVRLAHNFSILVPNEWELSNPRDNRQLEKEIEKFSNDPINVIFSARYFVSSDNYFSSLILIKYEKSLGITQNDLKNFTSQDIKELESSCIKKQKVINKRAKSEYDMRYYTRETFLRLENTGNFESVFTYSKYINGKSPYIQLIYTLPFTNYSIEIIVIITPAEYEILLPIITEMIHSFKRQSDSHSATHIKPVLGSSLKSRINEYIHIINEA